MSLSTKVDYRFDPFTEEDQAVDITAEGVDVPANTPYYITLEEVPRQDSPSSVVCYDVTDGITLSEVSAGPADGEYQVDYKYKTGKIRFNSAQASHHAHVTYKGTGHCIRAKWVNDVQTDEELRVIAPATNTADKVPQWNGANSKTVKDGLAVGVAANNLLQLNASAQIPAVDASLLEILSANVGRKQLITTTGASHFTTPAGVTKVYLTMVGGGAGGGTKANDSGDTNNHAGAGGGGAGGSLIKYPYTVSASTEYDVSVGAGGGEGAGGGNTTFDTITVNGGSTGATAGGPSSAGGAGGNNPDAYNAVAYTAGLPYFPGGNGGTAVTASGWAGGAGGASRFGAGGAGGAAGTGYGAGGGGGAYQPWTGAAAGGAGSQGFVLVEW
jgi:hypothetical protein